VLALFPDKKHPDPEDLLKAKPEKLRSAGLSRQKIAALKDIAEKRLNGIIPHQRSIAHLPDEAIIERLTQAKGVGRWTAEMYLMFSLGRPDVMPVDDLGVRKGAAKILGRELNPKELGEYGLRWAPWRSAAAWHCWRAIETVTME
jgi:DNA-3-methyladenine glycosylase II